ncbi:MAG: TonB family protein [Hyphomonadaceae bacterium]|nr:TonB family protein [Hyphomonadaceae bacterium]
MSEHDAMEPRGGGARSKWLLAGIGAAVLLGGGYFAWTTFAPPSPRATQAAYDAASPVENFASDDDLRSTQDERIEVASAAEGTAAETPAPPAPRRAARTQAPSPVTPAVVPEETIGIMPAAVSPQDGDDIVITAHRPVWTRVPSARRLSALYPERALERGREGEARLHCTVQEGGALDCARHEETRREFGVAALRVARAFRHATTLSDGRDAVGTPVNLRVVFRMEGESRRRG